MLKFSNYPLAIALFSPITFTAVGLVPPVKLQALYGRICTGFPSTEPLPGLLHNNVPYLHRHTLTHSL